MSRGAYFISWVAVMFAVGSALYVIGFMQGVEKMRKEAALNGHARWATSYEGSPVFEWFLKDGDVQP
jgi:hypothetical protein